MDRARDDAQDAALVRLDQALRRLRVAEASGWRDYLINTARAEVNEARVAYETGQAVREVFRGPDGENPTPED